MEVVFYDHSSQVAALTSQKWSNNVDLFSWKNVSVYDKIAYDLHKI